MATSTSGIVTAFKLVFAGAVVCFLCFNLGEHTTRVAIAKTDMPKWTVLSREHVELRQISISKVQSGCLSEILDGTLSNQSISAGELFTSSNTATREEAQEHSVKIRWIVDSAMCRFFPGDRDDVLMCPPNRQAGAADVVVSDAVVFAINNRIDHSEQDLSQKLAILLPKSSEQSERLNLSRARDERLTLQLHRPRRIR